MASPSRPPTFRAYHSTGHCLGCGRKLTADEPVWFRGYPKPSGAFGFTCCRKKAAA